MKKQRRLRNLILMTIILITTVIIMIFGSVSITQFEHMLTERTVDDYQETVNAMQKNVETLTLYAEDFSKYMALNEQVVDTLSKYPAMLEENAILNEVTLKKKWDEISKQLIFSTSMMYSLEIYYDNNMIYSYYDDPSVDSMKNIPDEVLEKASLQASPVWSDLLVLRQLRSYTKKDEYGFAVVKSVSNENGQRIGLLAIFVRESSFANILEPVNEIQKSRSYLVDKDGCVISAVNKDELNNEIIDVLGLTSEEYKTCLQEGVLLKEEKNQDPMLYTTKSIGKRGMKLICETAMDELRYQQSTMKGYIVTLMIFSVIFAIISAWIVSRHITKPLGKLMNVMERIKTDEKDIHLRFPEGEVGEIGILGNRFNELMDELDSSMQQIYDEQRQRRHNEVRLLQAQIVPHFLYNTMGTISSFVKLGMTEKALETIQNLVSFYRVSLSSGKDVIQIKEEMELTRSYMELQQLRYVEYMEYSIECDRAAENVWVPKLTIQPLVENVLHHGFKPSGEKCKIQVRVAMEEKKERLQIIVHDNGKGIKKERLEQLRQSLEIGESVTKSFGIFNVNQRLKLMYGNDYQMEIQSIEGEYTQFSLCIWLKNKYEDEKYV